MNIEEKKKNRTKSSKKKILLLPEVRLLLMAWLGQFDNSLAGNQSYSKV